MESAITPLGPLTGYKIKFLIATRRKQGNNIKQNSSNNNQIQATNNQGASTATNGSGSNFTVGQLVIPYVKGTAKSFKHICDRYGIKVQFKGNTTIKQALMKPKDQDPNG